MVSDKVGHWTWSARPQFHGLTTSPQCSPPRQDPAGAPSLSPGLPLPLPQGPLGSEVGNLLSRRAGHPPLPGPPDSPVVGWGRAPGEHRMSCLMDKKTATQKG